LIAGDFFHAGANGELDLFKKWRQQFPETKFHLIKGNHDRLTEAIYDDLDIELHAEQKQISSFNIQHHPDDQPTVPQICGHIHPGVLLKGKAKQRLRLPCFLVKKQQIILPAFSLFTGLDIKFENKDFYTYAITENNVILLNR